MRRKIGLSPEKKDDAYWDNLRQEFQKAAGEKKKVKRYIMCDPEPRTKWKKI